MKPNTPSVHSRRGLAAPARHDTPNRPQPGPPFRRLLATSGPALAVLGLALSALLPSMQAAPTDISGLACWFDAAQGITTDGSGVASWSDQSGNGHTATRTAGTLSLANNQVNGLPTVRFRNAGYANLAGTLFAKEQYIVFKSPTGNTYNGDWGAVLGDVTDQHGYMMGNGTNFWNGNYPAAVSQNGTVLVNPWNLTSMGSFLVLKIVGAYPDTALRSYSLGNTYGNGSPQYHNVNLDVAEIIAYDHALVPTDENAVGGYLADKYQLTTAYPHTVVPPAPATLAASPLHHAVVLSWPATYGAADYNVYRSTSSHSYGPAPLATTGGATTYTDSAGLTDGTPYYYVVKGTNLVGEGPASPEAGAAPSAIAVAQSISFGTLASKTYGDAPFDLTATASSGLAVSYVSSDPSVASVTGSTVTLLKAGTATLTASQAGNADFTAAPPVAQSLTVAKASQTISFSLALVLVKQSNAAPFDDSATGGASGNSVTYASTNEAVATVNPSGLVTVVGLGTTQILANQPGDADHYSDATQVSQSLTVIAPLALPVGDGLVCWFDASVGVTTNGSGAIQGWNDQSGLAHHGTVGGGTTVLAANQLNSKPAAQFRGSYLNVAGTMFVKEQYLVLRSPSATWGGSGGFLCRTSGRGSSYDMRNGDVTFWPDQAPAAVSKNGTAVLVESLDNSQYVLQPITNYMILKIEVNDNAPTAASYWIGRADNVGTVPFDVAEIIGYNRTLTAAEEISMGSYLADKYDLITAYPALTPQAKILSFGLPGMPAVIDQAAKTIAWSVPAGTALSSLAPEFSLSDSATCDHVSGAPYNFTAAVHYLVNGSVDYTVTASVNPQLAALPVGRGLTCWFDASVGVTANGAGVIQNWSDLSGRVHHATPINGATVLAQNQINGSKPAAQFRGGYFSLDDPYATIRQQFIVARSTTASWSS